MPEEANVVVWSGGADSTLVLTDLLTNSTQHWPVLTLTVDRHPQLSRPALELQRAARKRYVAWAKKRGYHLVTRTVGIDSSKGLNITSQSLLWLTTLVPYVRNLEVLHFGYVNGDEFWHTREHALAAMTNMRKLSDRPALSVQFPLEYVRKPAVLERLRKAGVPNDCWWSCETPVKGRACRSCWKCFEIEQARAALRSATYRKASKRFDLPIATGKPAP
jgi:7-cyano-7-deazaguanine synthase in queuosine biosynthesis